jgi:hypothetical protein
MKKNIVFAVFAVTGLAGNVFAGPSDYISTPNVEYGEKEIDFKFGTTKQRNQDRVSATSIGLGYGATQYWFTELYLKYKREGGEPTKFDAFEWENKFQLTETGKYPVDIGLLVEIERPQDRSEGYELKFGPLFQTDIGKTQLNANILFERKYRADFANPMELSYQLQAKYRWKPSFEFGVQGFGEVGAWDHWAPRSEQSHRFGPAIFGKIPLGTRQAMKYNAAYLVDLSSATRSHTFRMQVEYEF